MKTRTGISMGSWLSVAVLAVVAAVLALPAQALDWAGAPVAEVQLFYPGQFSWEKSLMAASHRGAAKMRSGAPCAGCHRNDALKLGQRAAQRDGYRERSVVTVQVRALLGGERLHLQISGPLLHGKAPAVSLLLGDATLKATAQAGCWASCHDDAPGMASDSGDGLGKYLNASRSKLTPGGGGTSVRPPAELAQALARGEFLELLEVAPTGQGARGYVLASLQRQPLADGAVMRSEGERWIAELSRPLASAGEGQIALTAGKVYHFGIALHDAGSSGRQHLVSFAKSLAIGGGKADVVAPDA